MREGGGSIVAYETWLETGDDELLEAIRAYNEEDCRSTLSLRDWLLDDDAARGRGRVRRRLRRLREPEPEEAARRRPTWMPDVLGADRAAERRAAGRTATTTTPDQAERRLLAHLLLYHHREGKPAWWRYFELRGKPLAELIDERDAIAGLVRDARRRPPIPYKRSLDYTFTFPPQEFRLDLGDAEDPTTGESYNVVAIEDDHVVLRRGNDEPPPAPAALDRAERRSTAAVLREALVELAESAAGRRRTASPPRARILRREPPRLRSGRARRGRRRARLGDARARPTPSSRSRGRPAPARPSAARA